MAQNVIYWKFNTNTLYIRGTSASGYTTWSIPSFYSYSTVPWYSNRSSITSVIFETSIDVTTMSYWFHNCTNLNQAITIPNSVVYMDYCFAGCTSFNQPVTIPNNVTNMFNCFDGCTAFNSSVTFQATSKVAFMYRCFQDCTSFNQPVTIPNSVTDMRYCFASCTAFNSQVTFQETSKVDTMSYCFYNCTSFNKSITIPNSVTDMGQCFFGCTNFDKPITIPNNVTTMSYCFNDCTNFDSPVTFQSTSKVSNINYCFRDCTSFNQSITIPNSVTEMNYCFRDCTSFNSTVTFQATSKVARMYGCFYGCTYFNQSITIPNGVNTINYCFSGCTSFNKSITIPNSVTTMSYCFAGCDAFNSTVTFQATSKVDSMYNCFHDCINFNKSIIIPNSVTTMSYCFNGCTALNSQVTFQATSKVASMDSCFFGCKKFNQSIIIPNSVTEMSACFYGCTAFDKSITIPNNVTDMYSCFHDCINFNKSITIPNNVTNMDYCFAGCTAFNSSVTFQATSKVASMYYCFDGCIAFNQSITIPNSVTDMGYCFNSCTALNSTVTFQATSKVASMDSCFKSCANFDKSITIPNSVTNIHSCFSGCTALNSTVTFQAPSKFTNMYCCFFGCKKFNQSIIIPNSVTNMGECFSGCTNFNQSIIIPNSVTVMSLCFYKCTAFNSLVTFQATSKVDDMGACFSGCTNFNQSITIPNSVTEMDSCFRNCKNLNNVIIINKTNQAISYTDMFFGTEKLIVLDRSSTISIESLEQLAATANNSNVKVNNLAILASSATRNTENSSQIDIVVEVSDSYSHNIDIDICGSPTTSSSRSDVLWYDNPEYVGNPLSELEIDGSKDSTTFYGLIEDIDTDNSLSLFVICYYSLIETSFQELRIGSSYYTMDFLAGGKEIAIGTSASPDDIYSEVDETCNTPFTNEMFKTSDTNIDINKAYYDYNQNRDPKYKLVDLSQYTEDELDSINPSSSNTTYNTPWYDIFQETEFYQRINKTEYERLNTKPQNWMDIPSYTQIASEVEDGFEYTVSLLNGRWKIEIGIQFFDDASEQIYWNAGIFDYGVSRTYRNVKLVEYLGETYRITIGYNSQNNKIIMSRIGDFSYKVNYYMRTTPLYFTLSSTRGIFKCGMDAIFRSKQAPEVFKSMYDLIYPVGSVYTTNTYTNPKAWLGGNWSLIDKKFASAWKTFTNNASWTSYTKTDRALYGKYIGNSIEFRTNWTTNTALSDVSRNIFNIPWSTLGLTALDHAVYLQANADGANAVGIGSFTNYTYFDPSGNAGTTDKTKGSLIIHDWVTRAASYPTATGYGVAASFIMTVSPSLMVNSFCDQFIWKRIS